MPLKRNKLAAIIRALPKELDKAAEKTAKAIKQRRDELVPYDSGDLLESGEAVPGEQLGRWMVREGDGLPDARATFTEFGTDDPDYPVQPHMTPAAEENRAPFKVNVADAVRKAVKR